jgi:hypothetical protein
MGGNGSQLSAVSAMNQRVTWIDGSQPNTP